MTIGPVQLMVLGFNSPDFQDEIIAELERLRDNDMVRVIDSLVVRKDDQGDLEIDRLSTVSAEDVEVGGAVGALLGLGVAEEGVSFADERTWDVLYEIPNDSAAALVLLEHHWAVPLRDAVARSGGFPIGDGFISPLDLVDIGLISIGEAQEPQVMQTAHIGSRA